MIYIIIIITIYLIGVPIMNIWCRADTTNRDSDTMFVINVFSWAWPIVLVAVVTVGIVIGLVRCIALAIRWADGD